MTWSVILAAICEAIVVPQKLLVRLMVAVDCPRRPRWRC